MRMELMFLVVDPSAPVTGQGSLVRMKVTNTPDSNPVVAFPTSDIGASYIATCGLDGECSLSTASALSSADLFLARDSNVLLFRSLDEISRYAADRAGYVHSAPLISYADAEAAINS